eukprot:TRINITY_DN2858_c0_g1_i4.p1 TRINITY_DN2858_c0_g1~~TRINITY_DN2858_c0_g1_i4.p1  ORF type:complete len:690 (-),score=47.77 TRINITY_DN2858_c0_g1_i4:919-2988(-)
MAGRKQHFIPKHFLKQFVTSEGTDKLWMYRRGLAKPVQVSCDDAAARRDFYSVPGLAGGESLDDLITKYENELSAIVDDIRNVPIGEMLPGDLIGEVVAHLTVRSAHMREFIDESVSTLMSLVDSMPNRLFDKDHFPKHKVPTKFMDAALEQLEKISPKLNISITPQTITRLLYQIVRENFDEFRQSAINNFSQVFEILEREVVGVGGKAQKQVLEKQLVPELRKSALEQLQWKVLDFPAKNAVLADCVAIAKDHEGWGPYILADQNSITYVVIPLSSSTLAVGGRENWQEVVAEYNQVAQDSSFTFYLTGRVSEISPGFLNELGGATRSKVSGLVSIAMSDAVKSFLDDNAPEDDERSEAVTWAEVLSSEKYSYQVRLADFGDENYGRKIGDEINKIVSSVSCVFPLHRLDGITFAVDYVAALRSIDRGQGIGCSFDPSIGLNPNGVCMPLIVRRPDGIKTHIVLRAEFAEKLISEHEKSRSDAVSVICFGLGTVAFNTLLESKFPGTLLNRFPDTFDGWLFQYNDALLAAYFSNQLIPADEETLEFFAELASEKLSEMIDVTSIAHKEYLETRDHEELFNVSAISVSSFMSAMARYYAAFKKDDISQRVSPKLEKHLGNSKLTNWSKLFKADLSSFNDRLNEWTIFDEVYFVNRHLERLLFEVGIVPDLMPDGSLYVHVSRTRRLFS